MTRHAAPTHLAAQAGLAAPPVAGKAPTTRPNSQWFDPHPGLGISMMDHLYNRLDGAYPHKWRSNFPDAQAIDNWAESWVEAFEDEGITPADVKIGLKECRSRFGWPPSCAEFIQACKPFADPLAAYHEALAGLEARAKGEMGSWSHPAVFWAANMLQRDLPLAVYASVEKRWACVLKAQMQRGEWEPIPEPRAQLPAPGQAKMSSEAAAQMLSELGAQGLLKQADGEFDHKRWARKLLARVAGGDASISIHQANAAADALRVPPVAEAGEP